MMELMITIFTQALIFLPLAFGISISYHILRATDMTIDGSFVIGAAVFARLVTLGFSPYLATCAALVAGALAGMMSATIQRGGRVEPLLAGVLATFILSSLNLAIMNKPNINLLNEITLLSQAFAKSDLYGWTLTAIYSLSCCFIILMLLRTPLGLTLRALGDNQTLLRQLGKPIELYRLIGFGITNLLAAASGCLTAQINGYADIGMGIGMTLTGIGAIIMGQQIFRRMVCKNYYRIAAEFIACLLGVITYFFALNLLLRFEINPIYLKMILGLALIFFLRTAIKPNLSGNLS